MVGHQFLLAFQRRQMTARNEISTWAAQRDCWGYLHCSVDKNEIRTFVRKLHRPEPLTPVS